LGFFGFFCPFPTRLGIIAKVSQPLSKAHTLFIYLFIYLKGVIFIGPSQIILFLGVQTFVQLGGERSIQNDRSGHTLSVGVKPTKLIGG
jgi:hypothetical protein